MRAFLGLARATHPLPALAVTTIVGLVAWARGAATPDLVWMVASTAAGQASVGWSNDFVDRDLDRRAGRQDKPIVSRQISARTVAISAGIALPLSFALSLPVGLPEAWLMLAGVTSAWAYNLLLKSTPLSPLPYAVSFGLAPLYIWLGAEDALPPGWVATSAALLGFAAHLLNVLPDLEGDRALQVRGLPQRIGARGSLWLACGVLTAVLVVILVADGVSASGRQLLAAAVAAALIAAVALSGLRGAARLGFRLTVAAAGAIVATFLLSPANV